jgi:hypothetical protein
VPTFPHTECAVYYFCFANLIGNEIVIMITRLCLGLSLPLLLGAGQDELPENWSMLVSKEGQFKIAMPKERMDKKQAVKTGTGQVLNVIMVVAEGANDSLFVVSYTDYPEADLKKGPIAKRLDQARDGAATSAGGKPAKEKSLDLKGHPGRDFCIDKNGEIVARMRIYLVKRRLYQVTVFGAAPESETKAFLDSFGLLE